MDVYRRTIQMDGHRHQQVLCLMSDLHLDASDHDRALLIADLEHARALNARVSINGDIFDAILPSDRKRHHPAVMAAAPDRDDLLNQIVEYAVNVLAPYADLIDVISPGNHERSVLKHHHIDIVSMLVYALNQHLPEGAQRIHQGSYRGFQRYVFKGGGTSKFSRSFTFFRHHGRGGGAPVTGGAIDLNRIRQDFDADLYWMGHKHQNIGRGFTRISMSTRDKIQVRKQRAVMSEGYKRQFADEDPGADGDIGDYGETFYAVSEQGAQWVLLELSRDINAVGFDAGLRWSVADSPHMLGATV